TNNSPRHPARGKSTEQEEVTRAPDISIGELSKPTKCGRNRARRNPSPRCGTVSGIKDELPRHGQVFLRLSAGNPQSMCPRRGVFDCGDWGVCRCAKTDLCANRKAELSRLFSSVVLDLVKGKNELLL